MPEEMQKKRKKRKKWSICVTKTLLKSSHLLNIFCFKCPGSVLCSSPPSPSGGHPALSVLEKAALAACSARASTCRELQQVPVCLLGVFGACFSGGKAE